MLIGLAACGSSPSGRGTDPDDPRYGIWRVQFARGGVSYHGEFHPIDGRGGMILIFTGEDGREERLAQSCTIFGGNVMSVECKLPSILSDGNFSYTPDNFRLRLSSDRRTMTGDFVTPAGEPAGAASFTRGTDPQVTDADFSKAGPPTTEDGPGGTGDPEKIRLARLVASNMQSELPKQQGIVRITAVMADGAGLRLRGEIDGRLNDIDWGMVERSVRAEACRPAPDNLIRRGLSLVYEVRDRTQDPHTIIIVTCGRG